MGLESEKLKPAILRWTSSIISRHWMLRVITKSLHCCFMLFIASYLLLKEELESSMSFTMFPKNAILVS